MNDTRKHENANDLKGCERGEDAIAWMQGELSTADRASVSRHLQQCAACQALVADAEAILGKLGACGSSDHQQPAVGDSPGAVASDAVSAPDDQSHRHQGSLLPLKLVALASAASILMVIWFSGGSHDAEPQAGPVSQGRGQASALDWVESHLSADGTWYAFSRGGPRAQELGMHAFGLLALVRGAEAEVSPGRLASVRDAAHWLVGRQNEDGSIGLPLSTGRLDHPVAALALLEAGLVTGDAALRDAAEKAIRHLADQRVGLWGRGGQRGPAAWSFAALVRADQLGHPGLEGHIEQGRRSLGPEAAALLDGDFLGQAPFWQLALGGVEPSSRDGADNLFSASLAVLAPQLR